MIDKNRYVVTGDDFEITGEVGQLVEEQGISLKISSIDATEGTEFTIYYVPRLKAISDLQENLTVADLGKDTGILSLSLIGDDKRLIKTIIDSISANYLAQNISRQAAQDAKV